MCERAEPRTQFARAAAHLDRKRTLAGTRQHLRRFEDAADAGVEETWSEEIKRRVDEIRLGKVKMVLGEEMRRWFSERLRDAKK